MVRMPHALAPALLLLSLPPATPAHAMPARVATRLADACARWCTAGRSRDAMSCRSRRATITAGVLLPAFTSCESPAATRRSSGGSS